MRKGSIDHVLIVACLPAVVALAALIIAAAVTVHEFYFAKV